MKEILKKAKKKQLIPLPTLYISKSQKEVLRVLLKNCSKSRTLMNGDVEEELCVVLLEDIDQILEEANSQDVDTRTINPFSNYDLSEIRHEEMIHNVNRDRERRRFEVR